MRYVYIDQDESSYNCPYCNCEIVDCTGDDMEGHSEYCPSCGTEFIIEVV